MIDLGRVANNIMSIGIIVGIGYMIYSSMRKNSKIGIKIREFMKGGKD